MSNTILYGRVVRDIEVRYTNQNMAVARFSIAVNRKYKSEDKKADFFNITAFGKKAETLSQYFHQGSRIVIYCHPQQEQYTKQDGTKVDTVVFILDEFDFVDTRAEGGITANQNPNPAPEPTPQGEDWMSVPDNLDDESLPFN
mgnify:FL=1